MNEDASLIGRRDLEAKIVSKAWKDADFAARLRADPKAAIRAEFGLEVPAEVTIRIMEERADQVYVVLPKPPVGNAGVELTEDQLEAVAGGGTPILLVTYGAVLSAGLVIGAATAAGSIGLSINAATGRRW